jgi:hypothetical protein
LELFLETGFDQGKGRGGTETFQGNRPVPRNHYDVPLPTVSTKVKDGTTGTAKKVKKTQEPIARPGLVMQSCVDHESRNAFVL